MKDLFYLTLIVVSSAIVSQFGLFYRIDMVQQSQEKSFRQSLERNADLLFKLSKIEKLLEEKK